MKLMAARVIQKGATLYVTVAKASFLLEREAVDAWSLSNTKGYQRPLVPARVREAARYLTDEEGIFPTSVLVNVRGKVDFEPTGDGAAIQWGWLDIPDGEDLWIVDGQHRLAGVRSAIERGAAELADYPLPLTISVLRNEADGTGDEARYQEMRQFYIINTRAKGVPPDIAERLLVQMREEKGLLEVEKLEGGNKAFQARAVKVVDLLREMEGPWKGMVVVPGEVKPSKHAVRQHVLVASLIDVVKHPTIRVLDDQDIARLINQFWAALRERMPEAFDSPADYSMQRTAGIYSLHMIFADVFERCREARAYDKDMIKSILGHIEMDSTFWHLRDGDPRTFGTSMRGVRLLASYLREQLPPIKLAGL